MKRLVIGMTAHVDSGKTTLSEAMLYRAGELRRLGRVDKGDAFLDTHSIERSRGITVFSKQAVMRYGESEYTILDTPGHADFSSETERALRVLDYAILVISGTDGVQSHTETLWRLLARYKIPAFIFVNKMDISAYDQSVLMGGLSSRLSAGCVNFSGTDFYEDIASLDEGLMNIYLDSGGIPIGDIRKAIAGRKIFPCFFGSALKLDGIDELLRGIDEYTEDKYGGVSDNEFGASVYKITEEQGARLTHMKMTNGSIKVKTALDGEKINRIRIYSGAKFHTAEEVFAGTVCAVEGLSKTYAGQGLGSEKNAEKPLLEPVMTYRLILPDGTDMHDMLQKMRRLEEEDPQLHVIWNERLQEIHLRLMGKIQLEILSSIIQERFGISADFAEGSILYKETISAPVTGAGHYEPLKHYAEVHLLLEPAERGSSLEFSSSCREDDLDKNLQRLILTHLAEKQHIGVLTGSPVTDMKITLTAGRAHLKHTEGGDFRQATYRAVRQGLRKAKSVLLEPWYGFTLEIPADCVGRAMTDIQRMSGEFSPPEIFGDNALISGTVPASEASDYQFEVLGYTTGKGRFNYNLRGYFPCHNAEEVIAKIGYDCDGDLENTADSVFCSHGAGYVVKWDEADEKMHISKQAQQDLSDGTDSENDENTSRNTVSRAADYRSQIAEDKELMAIFEMTYGKIDRDPRHALHTEKEVRTPKQKPTEIFNGKEYLLVDGYNIIFSWDELSGIAKENLDLARSMLINTLCNYRGFKQCDVILVFDAYKVKGGEGSVEQVGNISVVYTKEAETADMYIEKVTHELSKGNRIRVATSDGTEQIIILGNGAYRVSASEFHDEVLRVEKAIREYIDKNR